MPAASSATATRRKHFPDPKTLTSIVAKATNDEASLDLQYPEEPEQAEKAEKADKLAAKVHKKRASAILREIAERVRETTEEQKKFAQEIRSFPGPSAPSAPSLGAGVLRPSGLPLPVVSGIRADHIRTRAETNQQTIHFRLQARRGGSLEVFAEGSLGPARARDGPLDAARIDGQGQGEGELVGGGPGAVGPAVPGVGDRLVVERAPLPAGHGAAALLLVLEAGPAVCLGEVVGHDADLVPQRERDAVLDHEALRPRRHGAARRTGDLGATGECFAY
ncbi:hypothetical protein PG985_013121 [Apiospora marii]|uniref:uncharacterized protein n=1 Tax=Apiospora marii TaxID=335849 RepID=UPI003131B38F